MMKKPIALVLAAVLVLCLCLTACSNSSKEKMDALAGTYTMTYTESEEWFDELMDSIDAYDEEIALVDKSTLKAVQTVTFDAQGNYSFSDDAEGTRACVRSFYEGYFDALYAGRTTLNAKYEKTFDNMTLAEFRQFFAETYNCENYEALLTTITNNAHQYDNMADPWETGTYTIRANRIYFTISGEKEAEFITYTLTGDTLTLTYSDGEQVYQKVK